MYTRLRDDPRWSSGLPSYERLLDKKINCRMAASRDQYKLSSFITEKGLYILSRAQVKVSAALICSIRGGRGRRSEGQCSSSSRFEQPTRDFERPTAQTMAKTFNFPALFATQMSTMQVSPVSDKFDFLRAVSLQIKIFTTECNTKAGQLRTGVKHNKSQFLQQRMTWQGEKTPYRQQSFSSSCPLPKPMLFRSWRNGSSGRKSGVQINCQLVFYFPALCPHAKTNQGSDSQTCKSEMRASPGTGTGRSQENRKP